MADRELDVAVGIASVIGGRKENEDYAAVHVGNGKQRSLQGIVAALADGVGGSEGGRVAAELAVRSFIDGYRAENEVAGVAGAAVKVLDGFNFWLNGQAKAAHDMRGAATTFTAAVLRGRSATFVHIGDSRAWHYRAGTLTQMTDDHTASRADGRQILVRALGLDTAAHLDIKTHGVEAHDRILLTSDGVHGPLDFATMVSLLDKRRAPQADAEALVAAALERGGQDNATAIVLDIVAIPPVGYAALVSEMEELPLRAPPRTGDLVDGFEIVRVMGEHKESALCIAKNGTELVVLKFPLSSKATTYADKVRFIREAFVGQRVSSKHVVPGLRLAEGRQTSLYLAMPYYDGDTLEQRLSAQTISIEEVLRVGVEAGKGLTALHKAGIIHRDIKPGNIMILDDGPVKLLDLGVARLSKINDLVEVETPGTAAFMAPELFGDDRGSEASDQYALAATMYLSITGRYPFGKPLPGSLPLFGPIALPSHYRAAVPAWLDAALARALSLKPEDRYGDIHEFLFDLEAGWQSVQPARKRVPLIDRDPALIWKSLCLCLAIALLVSLVLR